MVNAFRLMIFVIGLAVVIGSIMVTSAEDAIITINSPSDDDTVNTKTITVSGTVVGDQGAVIKLVTVNGELALGTGPEGGFSSWEKKISLQEGQKNKITVEATDIFDHKTPKTITVSVPTPSHTPTSTPTPTSTLTPTLTGSISITSIPSGAEVRLDDSFEGITPIALKDITVGFHSIKVTKEGYHSETRKTRLDAGKTKELNIPLKPLTGSISISSTPSGACVYLDGDYKRETPLLLSKVVVGSHTIKLTKSDYFDGIRTVDVSVGKTHHIPVNLTGYGSLDISTDPPGAKVYLDDVYTRDTPCMLSEVVMGSHTIKLTKFCYDDEIRNVSLSVGETLYLNENLTGYGSLIISSNPSGAKVYLDGNYKGETPMNISDVVVGLHPLKLTKCLCADVEKEIHVSAGIKKNVDESLSCTTWFHILVGLSALIAIIPALYKWIIPFIHSKLSLFDVPPSYKQYLKEGAVDEMLKNKFKEKKEPLSPGAKVSIIDDKHWEIVDGEMQYRVEDKGKRLDIYKKKK